MSDDVRERSQPQSALDAAASVGEQGPDLADRARDRGAIDTEPARKDVVSDTVPKVDQGGQEPVDESPVTRRSDMINLRASTPTTHRPATQVSRRHR
jgi:hypothetical protein